MSWFEMTPAQIKREIKQDAARDYWDEYGPKCATCRHGITFLQKEYPYALAKDVAYCRRWRDLYEDPYQSNADIQDCWEE